jgi:rhodanese-related sulfurtransferase
LDLYKKSLNINVKKIFIILFYSVFIGLIYNHINPNGLRIVREKQNLVWEKDSLTIQNNISNKFESTTDSTNLLKQQKAYSSTEHNDVFKEPRAIKITFAHKLYLSGIKFIDARPAEEYREGHIKGAINIPFYGSENYEDVLSKIPKTETIVTYCSGDDCDLSILLGDELFKKGYNRIYVFFGGWNDWKRLGYPTERL